MQWKNYSYEIIDGGAVLTEYRGEEETVCIPGSLGGYPVTEIGGEAFMEYGGGVERIVVPPSVKRIADNAFKMCLSLTELVLPDGLEEIGEDAFFLTPLTRLFLPSTVSRIGKLWELGAIRWEVSEDNPYFFTDGYGMFYRAADGPELAVAYRGEQRKDYEIPAGTVRIGRGAFAGQESLEKVVCPSSLRSIGAGAFESCGELVRIFLDEGLEEIGEDAFGHCVNLQEILLPASLRVLGRNALTHTFGWSDAVPGISLIRVCEGNPVFWADDSALYEKAEDGEVWLVKYFGTQKTYTVSTGVFGIGSEAFRRAGVRRLVLPDSVRKVKKDAFRECKGMKEFVLQRFSEELTKDPGEPGGPDSLPEVVIYVPQDPVYRKDEVMELFLEERFDFEGYDRLFDTYLDLAEQSRMACCRLRYPACLSGETREKYTRFLRDNLEEILLGICAREDADSLVELAGLGFFDRDNIDACIDILNRNRRAKLLGFLINYKQDHFADSGFDFSL